MAKIEGSGSLDPYEAVDRVTKVEKPIEATLDEHGTGEAERAFEPEMVRLLSEIKRLDTELAILHLTGPALEKNRAKRLEAKAKLDAQTKNQAK